MTPTRPPACRYRQADPDVDGVALAAATATGVLRGTQFAVAAAWVVAACCLAVACRQTGGVPRLRDEGGSSAVVGVVWPPSTRWPPAGRPPRSAPPRCAAASC